MNEKNKKLQKISEDEDKVAKGFDKIEPYMFGSKYVIIFAVIISILTSFVLIGYGVYEFFHLLSIAFSGGGAKNLEVATLEIVDLFLFGMVMIIFAFGSYNLFISRLDNVKRDVRTKEIRPKWVRVENFSELKTIFIKVVIMILIITFLELVVTNIELFKEDIYSLLILPIGIVLIAFSLKLLHGEKENK